MAIKSITLTNFGGGAAVEKFDAELTRALSNIADLNTDPKATRTITLIFKLKPDQNRQKIEMSISSKTSLAADDVYTTQGWFGVNKETGQLELLGSDPKQQSFFEGGKVKSMNGGAE